MSARDGSGRGASTHLVAGSLALLTVATFAVSVGSVAIDPGDVVGIIASRVTPLSPEPTWTAAEEKIVWDLRVPRVLLAALVGAGLSVAGATLQAMVRNPLADPYLFGIASGASLAAVASIVLAPTALSALSLSGAAFVGAAATTLVVYAVAQQHGRVEPLRLILAGIAVGQVASALVTMILLNVTGPAGGISAVLAWLAGSLAGATWSSLQLPALVVALVTVTLMLSGRSLNALMSGDDAATSLGIDVGRFRLVTFLLTSLLVGTLVAESGAIGFVGLLVPHLARWMAGANPRSNAPGCSPVRSPPGRCGGSHRASHHRAERSARRRHDCARRRPVLHPPIATPIRVRSDVRSLDIRVDAVGVVIDGASILSDVGIEIGPGEIVGLIGPNGSGKTTLLRTIYRAIRPTAGAILVDDVAVEGFTARQHAQRVAVVAQDHPAEFDMTVLEVVEMGRTPHLRSWQRLSPDDEDIVAAAIDRVGLAGFEKRSISTLSGGERQRTLIARAVAQGGGVLLLDEPTNHLDIRAQLELLALLTESELTVVAALHNIALAARTCTQIVVLQDGRVVDSGPTTSVVTPALLRRVFGVLADISPDHGGKHLGVTITGLAP